MFTVSASDMVEGRVVVITGAGEGQAATFRSPFKALCETRKENKVARQPKQIRSDIAWSTADRITLRGKDLANDILGHLNLGDAAFLQLTGKTPTPQQSAVFNAIVITLVEHGITPSAIVARLTYAGAPESLQAAVAAGLCGLGTVFVGSME